MAEQLAVVPVQAQPITLFGTTDPRLVVAEATARATVLAQVIRSRGLAVKIGAAEHVRVEGWTLLGTMLGVFPVVTWTHPLEDGYEARAEARTIGGDLVGAAEAECRRSEGKPWDSRSSHALRSMAQTRAVSKCLRIPLGFVMALAGYDPTPAEEMGEMRPAQAPRPAPRKDAPATSNDLAAYGRGLDRAAQLGIDCAPWDVQPPIGQAELVAKAQALAVAIEQAEAEADQGEIDS